MTFKNIGSIKKSMKNIKQVIKIETRNIC